VLLRQGDGSGVSAEVDIVVGSDTSSFQGTAAAFGPRLTELEAPVRWADPSTGCRPLTSPLHGAVAVLERGKCSFVHKALAAQAAGARAVLVVDNTGLEVPKTVMVPDSEDSELGEPSIPSVLVGSHTGRALWSHTEGGPAGVRVRLRAADLEPSFAVVLPKGVPDANLVLRIKSATLDARDVARKLAEAGAGKGT